MIKQLSVKVEATNLSSLIVILPFVAAILFIISPADVHGWDPFKIGKAGKHVHLAISELNATVNKMPEQIKDTIGSNIKLMSDNVNQLLSRIDDQTVPLLNDSMKTQLNHMADLTNAPGPPERDCKKSSNTDRSRHRRPLESIAIHDSRVFGSGPGDDRV